MTVGRGLTWMCAGAAAVIAAATLIVWVWSVAPGLVPLAPFAALWWAKPLHVPRVDWDDALRTLLGGSR